MQDFLTGARIILGIGRTEKLRVLPCAMITLRQKFTYNVDPFREAEFEILYGEGISKWGEMVDLAVKLDIIQKSGSWFAMGETRLGQGRDAVKALLQNDPELAEQIEAEIRANSFKLMSKQSQIAAVAAGRAVDVSADDFEDEVDD